MNVPYLPESNATKRTRTLALIGIILYLVYGVLLGLIMPLVIVFGGLTLTNQLIYAGISALLLYSMVYRNIKRLNEIYRTDIVTHKDLRSFAISAVIGVIITVLLPIGIYNAILGLHFYKKSNSE